VVILSWYYPGSQSPCTHSFSRACGQTNISNFKVLQLFYIVEGFNTCTSLSETHETARYQKFLTYLSYIVNGFRHRTTIPFDHIVLQNISDQRLARTSRAAVSNVVVVLRVSESREVSLGFLSQSVRHSNDLQRCDFLNRDRSSINLIKWETC
jgi:hypothetical protein